MAKARMQIQPPYAPRWNDTTALPRTPNTRYSPAAASLSACIRICGAMPDRWKRRIRRSACRLRREMDLVGSEAGNRLGRGRLMGRCLVTFLKVETNAEDFFVLGSLGKRVT